LREKGTFEALYLNQGNRVSFLKLALQAVSQQVRFQKSTMQTRATSRLKILMRLSCYLSYENGGFGWIVMKGESKEEIQKELEAFPLYSFMVLEIATPPYFHSVAKIPGDMLL
jgi:hypothetical protein